MNRKFVSQVDGQLLASVLDTRQQSTSRADAASDQEILQVCALKLSAGRQVNPHKHLSTERQTVGTQECWVVLSGKVKVQLYDIDNTLVNSFELEEKECMTTYRGGHSIEVIDDSVIIEIKNGPYYGPDRDSQALLEVK